MRLHATIYGTYDMTVSENKTPNLKADLDVLLVGAGFAGVYQLKRLRDLGYNVKLYEAGNDIGGVWHWNCYPGARVDSTGDIYQFSDPDLWKDWDYAEKFPDWKQLRNYFDHVDKKWQIRNDCCFGKRISKARFDDAEHIWTVDTEDGETVTCRWFVLATGFASRPITPDFPGKDTFKGIATHTGLWPEEGIDWAGKRVGVIGTGASGVQVIQEASKEVGHLTVFQRTPNLAIPMRQKTISPEENKKIKEGFPELFKLRDTTFAGFDFDFWPETGLGKSVSERDAVFDEVWKTGAFNWWLGNFVDVLSDEGLNTAQYEYWRDRVRERVNDPALYELLAPTVAPHPFGMKRPCLEQWFYECFNQENVDLVDTKSAPIERITETGVVAGDEHYKLDILIYATGFDAVSGGLIQIDIEGTDGRSLSQHWEDGIEAFLGVGTPAFPNLLMLYGPQSPSGFCNGPTCAEVQGDWLASFIDKMTETGVARCEVTREAAADWAQITQDISAQFLFDKADSWYLGANVPGKKREFLIYPGGLPAYVEATEKCSSNGYDGFVLETA